MTSQADVGSPDLRTVALTYDYDANGNRTSMDDSQGGLVSYTYDARNELTNETLSGSGLSAMAVANSYDNAGNMTGQTRYFAGVRPSRGGLAGVSRGSRGGLAGVSRGSRGGLAGVSRGSRGAG